MKARQLTDGVTLLSTGADTIGHRHVALRKGEALQRPTAAALHPTSDILPSTRQERSDSRRSQSRVLEQIEGTGSSTSLVVAGSTLLVTLEPVNCSVGGDTVSQLEVAVAVNLSNQRYFTHPCGDMLTIRDHIRRRSIEGLSRCRKLCGMRGL